MQNTRTSKSLSAVIASATFTATKLHATTLFEDILFLEMISKRDTLAYQLLSNRLSLMQLEQIETQIRRIVSTPHLPTEQSLSGITPDIFYSDMLSAIDTRYPNTERISTIHALHFVLSNPTTIASRSLAMMGLTLAVLDQEIAEYSQKNAIAPLVTTAPQTPPQPKPHPLAKFGVELTALAKDGKIDPVIGREAETQRVIEILARRKKNNPILIGEAGVGKSAIVEGLARRIASGDVPPNIAGKRLFAVDISALVAGTKFRGEFEERMQQLLKALSTSQDSIIFIDEIHTIVGAGSTQGSLDTGNILKPALARGDIQTIGATTLDEYRTNIESDAALERRFNKVMVEPTTIAQSIEILRRIAPNYEEHHRVLYTDSAIEACVRLSHRYINDRHLPDKAIDLMDEAGARANINRPTDEAQPISHEHIEQIIASATGIPTQQLSDDDLSRLRSLESHLSSRVIGQSEAVRRITRAIQRSRTGLSDAQRPIGVFIFAGPTGVGKTLLAKELSQWMFGANSRNLIRIDMSEYNESHTLSRLVGSPPGYIGYSEGGELTEAVRRNPYSVVLLDEIEKAHPDIYNLMLQVFDEGRLTDGTGRVVDLRNTIIIMTSNVGSQAAHTQRAPVGYNTLSKANAAESAPKERYTTALERQFTPEFLNRIDEVLHFRSLDTEDMEQIIGLELDRIISRAQSLGYDISITTAARRRLAALGYQSKYGARSLRRTLLERVEEPLSEMIVNGKIERGMRVTIEQCRKSDGVRIKVA